MSVPVAGFKGLKMRKAIRAIMLLGVGVALACAAARAPQKDGWTQKLKGSYRSQRGGSNAGLEELIRGALDRPLPNL
jgi:hypothetical protein